MKTKIIEHSKDNIHTVAHYLTEKPCSPETLIAEGIGSTIEKARESASHGVKILTGFYPIAL
jgi:hypothetical protein